MSDQWNEVLKRTSESATYQSLIRPYLKVMPEYSLDGSQDNENFYKEDPNIGYKFHLNVLPQNVASVSIFLTARGFCHKYLSGGDVTEGKIFTVYSGGKLQTERIVREVSDAISHLLEPPVDTTEVLFAPNIAGRFRGEKQFFHQYGREGISLLNDLPLKDPHNTPERAQAKATELYGTYYGGGITYYQPGMVTKPIIHK